MLSTLTHEHTLSVFSRSYLSARSPKAACSASAMSASVVRIAVVGDVDLQEDTKALQPLKPDLVLFTGDFGNENIELVQSVAQLEFPKAVILGNHDSWKTQEFSGKRKNDIQLQLECLGEEHVAYRRLDFPTSKLSIVGGRPFSCGGQQIFRKRLLSARYGVQDMDESAKRIYKAAMDTPEDHSVILLAHNGPMDLAQAISRLKETTKLCIPLVVFGHVHKELAYGNGLRKMIAVGADNTIYLSGAIVPRVKRLIDEQGTGNRSFMNNETSLSRPKSKGTTLAFTVVEILDGRIDKIAESWVAVFGDSTTLQEEHVLFKHSS